VHCDGPGRGCLVNDAPSPWGKPIIHLPSCLLPHSLPTAPTATVAPPHTLIHPRPLAQCREGKNKRPASVQTAPHQPFLHFLFVAVHTGEVDSQALLAKTRQDKNQGKQSRSPSYQLLCLFLFLSVLFVPKPLHTLPSTHTHTSIPFLPPCCCLRRRQQQQSHTHAEQPAAHHNKHAFQPLYFLPSCRRATHHAQQQGQPAPYRGDW